MKYNLKSLMHNAWNLYRKNGITFAAALRIAWANAKLDRLIKEHEGVTEEAHSFSGWRSLGFTVRHGEHAAYSVMIADPAIKSGFRKKSFFTRSQVEAIQA